MRKIAYISGPYRSKDGINGIAENIWRARKVAVKYWKKYDVLCPHMNTAFMDAIDTDDVFLNGDLNQLRRCDVIVMMEHWIMSEGATKELELARECGLEVIFDYGKEAL